MVRVEIMDDSGTILAAGQTGEICVRGDLVMRGHYNAPEKTAETIIDGGVHTGDIGHLGEVDQVIWAHPAVQDCAVIGVPHPEWGEAVTAVVELNEGAELAEDELLAYCRPKLGGIK